MELNSATEDKINAFHKTFYETCLIDPDWYLKEEHDISDSQIWNMIDEGVRLLGVVAELQADNERLRTELQK